MLVGDLEPLWSERFVTLAGWTKAAMSTPMMRLGQIHSGVRSGGHIGVSAKGSLRSVQEQGSGSGEVSVFVASWLKLCVVCDCQVGSGGFL